MSSQAATATAAASLVPYVCVSDSAAAIDWYVAVFDAVETVRYVGDDGRIGHAEVSIGSARLMLSDEYPEIGVVGPQTLGGTPFTLNLNVGDVDAVWARAIEHGANGERPPTDQPYGERSCTFRDPSGHRWSVQTTISRPTPDEVAEAMEGYTVVTSAPAAPAPAPAPRARLPSSSGTSRWASPTRRWRHASTASCSAGRRSRGSSGAEYAHVNNTQLPLGFTPDGVDSPPALYFRVDDAQAYAAHVRELGGTIVSETTYDSGGNVVCRDDQGREFQLWQPAPGY